MTALRSSEHGVAQGGRRRGTETQGRGRGDIPGGRGSGLAADEVSAKAGPGLESSIINLRIEEILVLSEYSQEVILINPHAFRIKSRR